MDLLRVDAPEQIWVPRSAGRSGGSCSSRARRGHRRGAGLLALHDHETAPTLTLHDIAGRAVARTTGPSLLAVLGTSPFHAAVHQQDEALTVDVLAPRQSKPHPWPEAVIRVHVPHAAAIGLRDHGDVITVHDRRGRIVGVDTATARIVANLTLRE